MPVERKKERLIPTRGNKNSSSYPGVIALYGVISTSKRRAAKLGMCTDNTRDARRHCYKTTIKSFLLPTWKWTESLRFSTSENTHPQSCQKRFICCEGRIFETAKALDNKPIEIPYWSHMIETLPRLSPFDVILPLGNNKNKPCLLRLREHTCADIPVRLLNYSNRVSHITPPDRETRNMELGSVMSEENVTQACVTLKVTRKLRANRARTPLFVLLSIYNCSEDLWKWSSQAFGRALNWRNNCIYMYISQKKTLNAVVS